MRLKSSLGANEMPFINRDMKNHLRYLPFVLAFTLAPLAQAQATTVFDSSATAWSAASSLSSQNADGTTTTATHGTNSQGVWGTDYYSLGSAVHTGSGIWTLTVTAQQNFDPSVTLPPFTSGPTSNMQFGFGNLNSTSNFFSSGPSTNNGGPYLSDWQGPVSLGNPANHAATLVSGAPFGSPTILNGFYVPSNPPLTAQGAQTTYQMVLNTDGPAWTLQFLVNGQAVKYNEYADAAHTQLLASDVTTLTYGSTLPVIDGIGVSASTEGNGTVVFTEKLTNDTAVAAVPEASTWAMMVLGFGGLGLLGYRRSRRNGGLSFRLA
jgi:hypothetical protein